MIDWKDPKCKVTDHFTVRDCLWLNTWGRLANEDDGLNDEIKCEIIKTCEMAEKIRTSLGVPMIVTSFWRPPAYSKLIGGSETDPHTKGLAIDFTTRPKMLIETAKQIIRSSLYSLSIRMEKGTTDWIHLDRRQVGPSGREFTK